MFVSRCNPTTGKAEWIVQDKDIEEEDCDLSPELARSQYGDMLHDRERNQKYDVGLQYAVQSVKASGRVPYVLDIGAGTGLLSMMAARAGAAKVTACEVMKPMVKIAREVIKENRYDDIISVVGKRSTETTAGEGKDMPIRANIMVSEVFDTELIGEGAIATFAHAHSHLLEPGSIVIPSAATITVQLFESEFLWSSHKLDCAKPPLNLKVPPSWTECTGPASLWDLHMEQLRVPSQYRPLSSPVDVERIPFTEECVSLQCTPESSSVNIQVLESGVCHGIAMWWTLQMAPGVTLSTDPWNYIQWRDHWLQAVQLFPVPVGVAKGEVLSVRCHHDDYNMWFGVSKMDGSHRSLSPSVVERPVCTCGVHTSWSKTRISLSNNHSKHTLYLEAMKEAVSKATTVVCVSEGSMLPWLLARASLPFLKKIVVMETSSHSARLMRELLKENGESGVIEGVAITVLDKPVDSLTTEDFGGCKIDAVVGEPFFLASLLPWHDLYLWYAVTALWPHLSLSCTVLPGRLNIRGVAVSFQDLHMIKAPVGVVEALDISAFDRRVGKVITSPELVEPESHPLWEYPCQPLSEAVDLMQFDVSVPVPESTRLRSEGSWPLCWADGRASCHAVVLWMDAVLSEGRIASSGPTEPPQQGCSVKWDTSHKQAVYFLPSPKEADGGGASPMAPSVHYKLHFDTAKGELAMEFVL
ncbi:hypothetical protein EMCRGX_G030995 [Ephydatia muelleri]